MKTWKKNLVAAAVLVTVCTGIYVNWLYTEQNAAKTLTDTLDVQKVMSDDTLVLESADGILTDATTNTATDYFAAVCPNVDWETVAIVVVKIEAEFLSQIKAGEHISARTRVVKIGNKSFQLDQDIINTDTQEVKCRCLSVMVLYDLVRHQSMPVPAAWRHAICQYDGLEE